MGKSLEEVHESVSTQNKKSIFKKIFCFGPAYLISVLYGSRNWATDLAGGSQFDIRHWVLLMSN
jgi:manganese transport protein